MILSYLCFENKKDRILDAVNYLLLKNKNIIYCPEINCIYDKQEKMFYDCETGEKVNRHPKFSL